MKGLALVVVIAIASTGVRRAEAGDCDGEADALHGLLAGEARRASRWNVAWGVFYGAAVAGQLALALTETKPFATFDRDYEEMMYVGAAKATVGVISKLVVPLRVSVPARTADACVDLIALRRAVERNARRERQSFYLNHFGGLAVNLAGVAVLAARRGVGIAAQSFAIGFPVGIAATYSQPRRAWKAWRANRASWRTGVTAGDGATVLWLAGEL
ncbi:MAG: hypothetical protein KIT31_42145 [Deltaproteobacteria bacterium]|nr:hypothetical protein [Deltaproteobacteria bacterium]